MMTVSELKEWLKGEPEDELQDAFMVFHNVDGFRNFISTIGKLKQYIEEVSSSSFETAFLKLCQALESPIAYLLSLVSENSAADIGVILSECITGDQCKSLRNGWRESRLRNC